MADTEVHGPIDTTIIEFPAGASGTGTARALLDLVEAGTIRLYDLMLVGKGDDGDWSTIEVSSSPDGALGELMAFAGARSGLVDDDDAAAVAEILQPGSVAAVLVYENAWAAPFVAAARAEGAELVASSRLTAQQVMDALDAIEASDETP